jgi:integrase/recombinase XerD
MLTNQLREATRDHAFFFRRSPFVPGVLQSQRRRTDSLRRALPFEKYVTASVTHAPTLRSKRLHPRSMRDSTDISLLKAGIDFATIAQWLGHASLNTTMRYARSGIDLRRAALAHVFPAALAPPKAGRLRVDGTELMNWLRRL